MRLKDVYGLVVEDDPYCNSYHLVLFHTNRAALQAPIDVLPNTTWLLLEVISTVIGYIDSFSNVFNSPLFWLERLDHNL